MNKTNDVIKFDKDDVSLLKVMQENNHLPYPEFRAKVGEAMQKIADKKFANYNKCNKLLLED